MMALETAFRSHADPAFAAWQAAYMRHQFSFFGIRQPIRKRLQKLPLKRLDKPSIPFLWEKEEREWQYVALDLSSMLTIQKDDLSSFEWMISTKSWWDTVDVLASNLCGKYFRLFPEARATTRQWLYSPCLWLRRSALLFQLRYKSATDGHLLFEYCQIVSHDPNPFIQRAIGWALREYGKTAPDAVKQFLVKEKTSFSSLTLREASYLLSKTN